MATPPYALLMSTTPRPSKLRVVVIAEGPPARGGIPTFATTLVDHEWLRSAVDIELLNTTRRAVRRGGAPSVSNVGRLVVDVGRTWRAARRSDVVHVQTALMPLLPLLRALALCTSARIAGAVVLCHVHSGRVNSGRQEAFSPGRGTRFLLRGLRVADRVLTVSRSGTAALAPLIATTVETVDNAVDVGSFSIAPLAGEPPVLVYLGTLSRRKGMGDLLEALHLLRERGVDAWRLVIVGGPADVGAAEAAELQAAVQALGLGSSLVGALAPPDVRAQLLDADVFVLPSHWEGQPIAILEAMATGLPIVTTSVGANPDVVRAEIDGILVEPHDPPALAAALERVLSSSELRRSLGSSARERVSDGHDLDQLAHRMAGIYKETVGRRG